MTYDFYFQQVENILISVNYYHVNNPDLSELSTLNFSID